MSWSYADTATQEGAEMDQNEIDILERNLKPCPLCLGKSYFDNPATGNYSLPKSDVVCELCGLRLSSDTEQEAAARWNTRPREVARNVVRSVSREFWTGY